MASRARVTCESCVFRPFIGGRTLEASPSPGARHVQRHHDRHPCTARRIALRPTHVALATFAIATVLSGGRAAGAQSATVKRAPVSTAQLSYVVGERVAVTTMLGRARSRDLVAEGDPRISVFAYDVGTEVRTPRWNVGASIIRLRFEVRAYVSGFHSLVGGGAVDARNDLVVLVGLRFRLRRSA